MAETTIPSDDSEATADAVLAALVTGYVILHDDAAGTATIVAAALDAAALATAVEGIS